MRTVEIVGLGGPGGDPVSTKVLSVRQDEATRGPGCSGDCPDARGVGGRNARLRAERDGRGDGRVYRVRFQATAGEASCSGEVKVCVPHDRSGRGCGDQGPVHDSTACGVRR
jgi:hypothetical protein